jgi:hypothetical protein
MEMLKELNRESTGNVLDNNTQYEEITKHISEMPIKVSYVISAGVDIQNLKDYHESLDNLVKKYASSMHKSSIKLIQ